MTNKVCKISLFTAILASLSTLPVDAAIRTNNSSRSYADAYNQVNALRYQQETTTTATTESATADLPVMVSNEKLASEILNNTSETTVSDLDACAMIYSNGLFRWEVPLSGTRRNQYDQCVAVVSLIDANTNAVLATTTLASGDSFKCNIDNFPESGMNAVALNKIELPADAAPTMDDVEAVMNEEQKQNAGFKIAAGAIIAGVAGNILSPKEAGSTKMFGTSKDQLIGTAAGVATGAGIMAASSYSGKVAGDTIKSTAVNAASGMVIGNMLAGTNGGDSYLNIQKCNISDSKNTDYNGTHDCIAGRSVERSEKAIASVETDEDLQKKTTASSGETETPEKSVYLIDANGTIKKCDTYENGALKCTAFTKTLVDITLETEDGGISFKDVFGTKVNDSKFQYLIKYHKADNDDSMFTKYEDGHKDNSFYRIKSAYEGTNEKRVYIVFKNDIENAKGHKKGEFSTLLKGEYEYFDRNSSGTAGSLIELDDNKKALITFTPSVYDASSGGLVDLSNKARTNGTLVGTAAGGALGGFAGYQGAQSEITDRWTAAVHEYEDSLTKFVCMTGKRYLSKYNDYVEIPEWKKQ
jgi:hypothetical protein